MELFPRARRADHLLAHRVPELGDAPHLGVEADDVALLPLAGFRRTEEAFAGRLLARAFLRLTQQLGAGRLVQRAVVLLVGFPARGADGRLTSGLEADAANIALIAQQAAADAALL